MRIGMILDTVYPPDPRVENEAFTLLKSGHEVFLFCLHYGAQKKIDNIDGLKIRRYISNKIEYKLSALTYTIPLYTNSMSKKIKDFLCKNSIEAIHVHDIRIAGAVFKANKKIQIPTILDLHDNIPEIMKLYPHLQKFPGRYIISPKKWKKKEELFIKKASKVITVSQYFVDELIKRTKVKKHKIILVPNTVRQSFYKDAILDSSIIDRYRNNSVLLYLGDTHLRRGLQMAISAVKELCKQIPTIKLVIVGASTTDSILKKQVSDFGLEQFVDFEGWKEVSLFPSYIVASKICLSPLHRNPQHDVAYANKIFQYMSFGRPLLVSDAKAQKNLVETTKSGFVHRDRDVNDFVEKVLLLLKKTSLCREMGANGKAFIENDFFWEKSSKNLVHLYNNINS